MVKLQGHLRNAMRVLVGLLCFGGAGAAAAAKDFDDIIIREAVTLWFKDRAAADAKYGHIATWRVDKVTDMGTMFRSAEKFNRPIGDWRVDKVTDMSHMFAGAKSFNQPLDVWRVDQVTDIVSQKYEGRGITKAQIYEANTAPPPRTCVSGRGPGAGRKRSEPAPTMCAMPHALASPFDPGRHSYEKSPREIPEAAFVSRRSDALQVRVRVFGPRVNPQPSDKNRPQFILRQHAEDGPPQDLAGLPPLQVRRGPFFQPTHKTRVVPIQFLLPLFSRKHEPVGVDDDDVVAVLVPVRLEAGLMFSS